MVTALQYGTWMYGEKFQNTCIKEKDERGGRHQLFYGILVADCMLRQDARRFMLGKYLSNKEIPWNRRRLLGMAVAENTPKASQLTKTGKAFSASSSLLQIL